MFSFLANENRGRSFRCGPLFERAKAGRLLSRGGEKMKRVSTEKLAKIIARHGKWLRGADGGERANLAGADMELANLTGADLTGAKR